MLEEAAPRAPGRRNNEKRKEKSRVAARCRRNKEQHIFNDLSEALPVRKEDVDQLDKASVMRLAISYLRCRDVVQMLPEVPAEEPVEPVATEMKPEDMSYLQALDGFVFVISQLGDVVYCSENIAEHIGVSQLEIMGQSVFEFSHACDHEELREVLRGKQGGPYSFLLRLKCTITSKGRSVHLKSASYKVIHFTGHVLTPAEEKELQKASSPEQNNNETVKNEQNDKMAAVTEPNMIKTGSLIAVGRPIPHPANIEIPLDKKTFLTKHGLNMKFTYSDDVLEKELGFEPSDLTGQSLFEYQHAADSAALAHHFKSLFSKGQCETGRYRFLAKTGGYAWVQTQGTLIKDKQQRPISVVCVNYLISGIECKDEVFSASQMRHADLKPAPLAAPIPVVEKSVPKLIPVTVPPAPKVVAAGLVANGAIIKEISNGAIVGPAPVPEEAHPKPATAQIFAPRTKEMNKGYLMFSEDDPGLTMLKEEPEDLTHLAPTAGDACIPLEDNPFDMFDEFILSDNYCSLLGDDLANGSPVESLGADSFLLSSPEPQESESSCEQSSFLTELSLDALDGARSEGELDGRAPYIPMSGTDELPVLAPAVMWGALPDSVSLAKPSPPEPAITPPTAPALQRLLAAPPHTGPPPQDIITNIYADQGLIPTDAVTTWATSVKRSRVEPLETTAKRAKRSPSPTPGASPTSSVLMNLLETSERHIRLPSNIVNSTQTLLPEIYQFFDSKTPHIQLNNQPIVRTQQVLTNPMSPLSINLNFNACHPKLNSSLSNSPYYSPNISPSPDSMSPVYNHNSMSSYPTPPRSNSVSPLLYNRCFTPNIISPGGTFKNNLLSSGGMVSPGGMLSPASMSQRFGRNLLTPKGVLHTGCDPFLTRDVKMLSPNYNAFKVESGSDLCSMLESDMKMSEADGIWMDTTDLLQDNGVLLNGFEDVKMIQ